jgi:hypothetical protein
VISARGTLAPTSQGQALAIASLTIGGSVDRAEILAGYDRTAAAVNADAAIGAVVVGRAWLASSLVAGATRGANGFFGADGGELIARDNPIVAKIASIVIRRSVSGTEGIDDDQFGFVAEQIRAFKAAGERLSLTTGPSTDLAGLRVGRTGDLVVREVA